MAESTEESHATSAAITTPPTSSSLSTAAITATTMEESSVSLSSGASSLQAQQKESSEPSTANSSFDIVDAPNSSTIRNSQEDMGSPKKHGDKLYGKCKWFNVAKGWGFITPNGGGQEVFVHQSVIQMSGFRSLGEQEEVEFEVKQTERGLEATCVTGLNGVDCHGSTYRPRNAHNRKNNKRRRIRCYNCGEFANHIASKCQIGPQPKRCHFCKEPSHLLADCPLKNSQAS